MIDAQRAFAPSYARARVQFLEAAAAAGMAIRSYNHPLPGRDGETLAMDVALDGPVDGVELRASLRANLALLERGRTPGASE